MCLAVYMASDRSLPLVAWNEKAPAFYVANLHTEDTGVRKQFTLPHVYYIGSHEGCGCGFLKEGEVGEAFEQCHNNYLHLAEYIRRVQQDGAIIELFSCWEGDQEEEPELLEVVMPMDLEKPEYQFREKLSAQIQRDEP